VFEVLVEAWTLRRKMEQIRLKRTRNGILRIAEFNLASCRNDMNPPLLRGKEQSVSRRLVSQSSIVLPNDKECEDAKGKTLKAMS
ncbi:hypothetical protein H5410_036110, partial [Solanum commersonii]